MQPFALEIMTLVMKYLDQYDLLTCTMVNSLFSAVATPLLWHTIQIDHHLYPGFSFLDCLMLASQPVGLWIRHVHIQNYAWTDRLLLILLRHTPLLSSLVLDNAARVTNASLQHINFYCPGLNSLYLEDSPITHVSYRVLSQMAHLTTLELWNCEGLQLTTFSEHFTNLRTLMLATVVHLDLTNLQQLHCLKLHGPNFDLLDQALTMNDQGQVVCRWPHLEILELVACFDMTDIDALALLLGLPTGLTRLTMKDGDFTDLTLNAIASYQPALRELDVSFNPNLTPDGVRFLVHRCRSLDVVHLDYCGFTLTDFPEATSRCLRTVTTFENVSTGLAYLDQHATDAIRAEEMY